MKWKADTIRTGAAACLLSGMLAGCATYHPLPLPAAPDLANMPTLTVPAKQFLLPGLAPHSVPANGFDEPTIVTLAVCDDPDLKAARLRAGVARAQMLEAGLLPDPQLSAGYAASAHNYGGALGLSEDLQALITRGANRTAASANQRQVRLNILWREWQVAAQAGQLFIEIRANEQLRTIERADEHLLARRYQTDLKAMRRGNQTATVVSSDLIQLSNAQTALRQLLVSINQTNHQLDGLLGLKPGVRLRLLGSPLPSAMSAAHFRTAVVEMPHRRADLLALQAGYKSQEAKVRRAVLMQFPDLSLGLDLERDPVEGVNSFGPEVSFTLPVFNRNRGRVAIERATRAVLRQTYQARLDSAENQAHEVWLTNRILAAQLRNLNAQLPMLKRRANAARGDLQQDDLDAATYIAMETGYLARRKEAIHVRAALESSRAKLRILLGLPLDSP